MNKVIVVLAGMGLLAHCSPGSITWGTATSNGGSASSGSNPNVGGGDPNAAGGPAALTCPDDASDPFAAARQRCVATINRYRATLGVAPLSRWCGQGQCIDGQAQADAAGGAAHSAFGTCGEFAQDECPGWPDPLASSTDACLAQMWAEGPGSDYQQHGHFLNMSNAAYRQVECGYYEQGNGSFWATQNFK